MPDLVRGKHLVGRLRFVRDLVRHLGDREPGRGDPDSLGLKPSTDMHRNMRMNRMGSQTPIVTDQSQHGHSTVTAQSIHSHSTVQSHNRFASAPTARNKRGREGMAKRAKCPLPGTLSM